MVFNPGLMLLDDGDFMPSLAALDVLVSAPTPTPTPIVDEQTKIAGKKAAILAAESADIPTKTVPQAAVPIVTDAQKDAALGVDRTSIITPPPPPVTVEKPDPTKTSYADLTPAQRAAMSQDEKMDYLQAAREAQMAADAAARAKTDPMFNFAVRPEAPQVPGMIQYYSWVGGVGAGQWKLYSAVDNDINRAVYGARSIGGATQGTPDSTLGANTLAAQPVWDPATKTWKPAGTVVTAVTPTDTADYTTVNGILNFKGAPFTGTYNGKTYKDGKVTTTAASGNTTGYVTTNGILNFNGVPFTGSYGGATYVNGVKQVAGSGNGNTVLGGNFTGSGSISDPFSVGGKPFTGTMFGSTYANGVIVNTAQKTADDIAKQGRLDARIEFGNTLKALGLPQSLVDEIDTMIKQDYTNSQMYLELQKTQAWKDRFPGMAALAAAGKAIDAGTYISQEKSMLQTLDYYGIDKNIFGTTQELGKQIANLVSPKRFETVVALAAQDVENNPDVLAGLNLYYGVDKSAAISYLLNPTIGLDIIQRQARAAEIGAKAAKSNFAFGMTKEGSGVAESFINAAGTMDLQALDVTFQQARGLSDIQSSIAATEGAAYNDLSAVSAILGKDQAAILDSQRRAARSVARFSGRSGLGSGSLASESSI